MTKQDIHLIEERERRLKLVIVIRHQRGPYLVENLEMQGEQIEIMDVGADDWMVSDDARQPNEQVVLLDQIDQSGLDSARIEDQLHDQPANFVVAHP